MSEPPNDYAARFDRLPPHSVEAEMCVLGAMMLCGDRRDVLADVRATVTGDDFYQADHQIIYRLFGDLSKAGKPIDGMTVREELIRRKMLDEVGGIEYLAVILSSVPSYANGRHYAAVVREKAVLRRAISAASEVLRLAYSPMGFDDTATAFVRKAADQFAELAVTGEIDPVVTLFEASELVTARRNAPALRRVDTGIGSLDTLIGGLARSKFTIIGADPRVGKSQIIKQIGMNIAKRGGTFGLVSIEEDREKVGENLLANETGVANHRIAYGTTDDAEWDLVEDGSRKFAGLNFYIDDVQQKLDDVVTAVERLAFKHGCEAVAVDHLHLISCEGQNREREVSKVSKALKATFKRCNVAGVAAAQLNRPQGDQRQKPTLRSLRDSGSLEADGDCIMLLYREDAFRYQEDGYAPTRVLEVNVAKNKDGRVGELPLSFDGEHQRIADIVQEDPFAPVAPRRRYAENRLDFDLDEIP